MFVTLEDVLIGARTIYGEGRGGSFDGMKAIGHVFVNRVNRTAGDADDDLASAALRHRQFSAWNEGDPNRAKMQAARLDDPVFRACLRAMLAALDEPDFTAGARHYMTVARRTAGWPGSWGPKRAPCFAIDDHLFYNDVD
jgi:spore germination cell wall hydrolase CwlJ-like protein